MVVFFFTVLYNLYFCLKGIPCVLLNYLNGMLLTPTPCVSCRYISYGLLLSSLTVGPFWAFPLFWRHALIISLKNTFNHFFRVSL